MRQGITIAGNMLVDTVKTISSYPKIGMLSDIVSVQRAVANALKTVPMERLAPAGEENRKTRESSRVFPLVTGC